MNARDIEYKMRDPRRGVISTANRIRRYSLDSRLSATFAAGAPQPNPWDAVRQALDQAWTDWLALRAEINALPAAPSEQQCLAIETTWLNLDLRVDLMQRDLVSPQSSRWGVGTVIVLTITFVIAVVTYLALHGVTKFDLENFEPWVDWGPVKYFEVAYWAFFGVLCSLMYLSTYYIARRDFHDNYTLWYLSTALRAPLLVVILMLIVLEFVEWYGEGKWIETYLLEEGNKYYFIVFMSFCLGVASEAVSSIIGDLVDGVTSAVQNIVRRVAGKLGAVVSESDVLSR